MMPTNFFLRLFSVGITVLVAVSIGGPQTLLSITYSLGFAHYLLALVYAKKQMIELAASPQRALPLLSVALLGAGMYFVGFSLVI